MRTVFLIFLLCILPLTAQAGPTKHWGFESYASFRGGKTTGVLLPNTGGLVPGLRTTRAKSADAMPGLFYSMAKLGNTLVLGSGDEAAIWTLRAGKLRKATALKGDLIVTRMVKGPGNTLLAATVPEGRIYKVSADGKATLLVKLPSAHVWDLAVLGNTVYAATGPEATLYAVDLASKRATKVWSVKEEHLLSLTVDGKELLVGTSPEARLYRVNPATKKGRLVYDFPGNEIRQILVDGKILYVTANQLTYRASTSYATSRYRTTRTTKSHRAPAALTAHPKTVFGRRSVIQGSGTLYMLHPVGTAEPMLNIAKGYFTRIQLQGDQLYGADGQSGRIYRINKKDFSGAIVVQTDERQVLDFILEKETAGYVSTGDGAALYSLSRTRGAEVSYESVVLNAYRAAHFGNVLLKVEQGPLRVETRSGTTPKPDDTLWSAWKPLAGLRDLPSGLRQGGVASPSGQYLQFRVKWPAGSKATLKSIQLFFTPENLRPRITNVLVFTGASGGFNGAATQSDAVIPDTPRMRSGDVRFSWHVLNWDGDALVYKVWIKKVGDKIWRRLGRKLTLTSTSFTWKAAFSPDGVYVARIEASDAPSNTPGTELTSTRTSLPFVVDNRAPVLTGLTVRNGKVNFSARDGFSRIIGATYRIGGGKWATVLPQDGLFDSMQEQFSFTLPASLPKGRHLIQIRVMDAAANIAAFSQEFTK